MIHCSPGPPGVTAIDRRPAGGADPIIEAGLDLLGGTPVINPVLQIANTSDMLRSLLTENATEHRVPHVNTIP